MDIKLKDIIGHRGFSGQRPENTLAAFSFAAEFGLHMVEFDVQLTKDDEWAVFHDATLERTTPNSGRIKEYTLAELADIDAGSWYDPPYPNERIPSLLETLTLTESLNLECNIEIKGSIDDPDKHATLLSEFIKKNTKPSDSLPLVSSFDTECLIRLRRIFPTLPMAYIIHEFYPDTIDIAEEYNFGRIHCDVNLITLENIEQADLRKIPIYLYTVNEKQIAEDWYSKGIKGFFSDHPEILIGK